jgi:hypothetical protein
MRTTNLKFKLNAIELIRSEMQSLKYSTQNNIIEIPVLPRASVFIHLKLYVLFDFHKRFPSSLQHNN